ncbi:MAG: TetR family transcriptional regulator [Brevundimonas sp.]|uniref:TetR/AcrR family transcriptional regulator n=1 Tax=Brevundimonas sp. TaxID=1871086 RepID=UPI002737596F|nr:TetR/AcrR family transcriptional regulator [Brevundimonas sp.]MDP3405970.1 TetR family transcriptional regulator [Brevundimonas sp.]
MSFAACPRPRNAAATRAAILDAASQRFTAESYEQVGIRDVARDVGVDPALISRYFGSKEELFRAVIDDCGNGRELMEGDRATFGERVAHDLVYGPRKENKLAWLLIMLRSASSPKAAEVVQRASAEGFYQPFTEWMGGEDAVVRVRIAAGLMMGVAVSRDLSGGLNMNPDECERMKARIARLLQDLVDG